MGVSFWVLEKWGNSFLVCKYNKVNFAKISQPAINYAEVPIAIIISNYCL